MKPKLSDKALKFKKSISPVRQIMNYADSNYIKKIGLNPKDLISFAGGWVNHNSPIELREAYLEISNNEDLFHQSGAYPPTLGSYEFKKSVINFEKNIYKMNDLKENQIAVGLGSTQLAFDLFQVLLDPNDKILLLDPSYCNYPTQIIAGMDNIQILRFPVLDSNSFEYLHEQKISEFYDFIIKNKPKIVLLISPDNPTSKVLSDDFVNSAYEAVQKIGSFLIIDYAYKEIVFDKNYPKYFSWGPSDNFISLRSNSKWGRGLGRRLGWIEASESVVESLESIQNSSILCPDNLHQMAFSKFVESSIKNNSLNSYIKSTNEKYFNTANAMCKIINKKLDYEITHPEGGLYVCMNVKINGAEFVDFILKNLGILFVPGWGFGPTLKNAVRISYGPLVNNIDLIEEGINKVAEFLSEKSINN